MKPMKKVLSLILTLAMVLTLVPFTVLGAGTDTETGDDFYKIVHLDAGRKYFSPENINKIIDEMAEVGYNQLELYLSDNQGFRFALDDMTITTDYGTYKLTPALGDGYSDGSKYPDGSGKYLTQSEMTEIISYAKSKGIEIVPCINVPGHMGAILEEFTSFRYTSGSQTSKSSIDLANDEAVAFALAITAKYAAYFAGQGCRFYNIGADEYANDLSSMGFQGLYTSGKYQKFVDFLNSAAQIVIDHNMTPRAFNDGIYYNEDNTYSINSDIQVCYWSCGWSGYNLASAQYLVNQGLDVINTHGDYYWVLGNTSWQCSVEKASKFDYTSFQYRTGTTGNSTISDPAGAMFCIWCDVGSADGTDGGTAVVSATADVIAAFATTLPETEKPAASTVWNTENTISVTAVGLTGVTTTETTAAIEGAKNVVAYDVTPVTADGNYTGEGKVTMSVPDGWDSSKVFAFIVNEDATITKLSAAIDKNGVATFTASHFSTMGLAESDDSVAVTESKEITLAVGDTTTDEIVGYNFAGTYQTEDTTIATVKVTGTDAVEATVTYTEASVTCKTLISSDSDSWTAASGYYYTPDGTNYYPVYAKRSSEGLLFWYTYTYTWGYSTTDSSSDVTQIGTQETDSTSTTPDISVYTKSGTDATSASTTVTFTGVSAGTTYVTVGNTRYTIVVVDKAPDNALTSSSFTLEYWITNSTVHIGSTSTTDSSQTISTASTGAQTEAGIAIKDIAPERAYSFFDGTVTVYYWQAMRLDELNKQTGASGDDETMDGTPITHVRYYGEAWQYKTLDGVWHYFLSTDQLVAYYLQKTEVDSRVGIDIYSKDWGFTASNSMPSQASGKQVGLTIAVVYPDGSVYPTESNMLANSTTIFNYWENRDIGIVSPENNGDYDIEKITVTSGTYTGNKTYSGWWSSTAGDVFDWEMTTNEAGSQWYNETVVWDDVTNAGTVPVVNGAKSGIIWPEVNSAKLVLIYLKPVEKETNLNVIYWDDSSNSSITDFQVVMSYQEGDDEPSYLTALVQTSEVRTGTITLDDDAYIINSSGSQQTFNKDISTVPDVAEQYKTGLYQYISAEISADGKTLTLHYNIDTSKVNKNYVVDFGLPVTIPLTDLAENATGDNTTVTASTSYGSAAIVDSNLVYTPSKILSGTDVVSVKVAGVSVRIGFIPATTVYYEEGFASYTGSWSGGTSKGDGTQTTSAAHTETQTDAAVYGFDAKYAAETGKSNGTEAVSDAKGDQATFTFTGTGVDIYANCASDTGWLLVAIKGSNTGTAKLYQVNTATGFIDGIDEEYGLPVVSATGLEYDTYTVTIRHIVTDLAADVGPVKLDGFRVYGTLQDEATNAYYTADREEDPTYIELRNEVLAAYQVNAEGQCEQVYGGDNSKVSVVLNDTTATGATTDDIEKLLTNGPKNELFLQAGQTAVFTISTDRMVQIGLKAPAGETGYTLNGSTDTTITTGTDMFYSVGRTESGSLTVMITNTGENILSITKIKVCDDPDAALVPMTADDVMNALNEPVVEEPVYADAMLQVFVNDASVTLTRNGVKGEEVTFTAAEIKEAATGQVPAGYELKNASFNDVTVVCGETESVEFTAEKIARQDIFTTILKGFISAIKGIFGRLFR